MLPQRLGTHEGIEGLGVTPSNWLTGMMRPRESEKQRWKLFLLTGQLHLLDQRLLIHRLVLKGTWSKLRQRCQVWKQKKDEKSFKPPNYRIAWIELASRCGGTNPFPECHCIYLLARITSIACLVQSMVDLLLRSRAGCTKCWEARVFAISAWAKSNEESGIPHIFARNSFVICKAWSHLLTCSFKAATATVWHVGQK